MSILSTIVTGGLGTLVKDVIGTFKLSPEKKAEFDAAIEANAQEVRLKELELEGQLADYTAREIEAASGNIRAEATSGDRYTSRARPSFIYVMLVILSCNYILFPLIQRPPLNFPEALFWLFGSCMLGYTGARSWEKWTATRFGK